jgi:hypothetical protein
MSARKTREAILKILLEIKEDASFDDRSDKRWIFATFANCYFALGETENGDKYETQFYSEKPAEWELTTYEDGKLAIRHRWSPQFVKLSIGSGERRDCSHRSGLC